jgi:hypothetical protein
LFHLTQILKGLDAADDLAVVIAENSRGNANGDTQSLTIDDVGRGIHDRLAGVKRLAQSAVLFTYIGVKHIPAGFAERFASTRSRDPLGGAVKRSDPPIHVNGEHSFVD